MSHREVRRLHSGELTRLGLPTDLNTMNVVSGICPADQKCHPGRSMLLQMRRV